MGYADGMRFKEEELALLDRTREIEVETSLPGGAAHRTIIWIVVAGHEAVANPSVTIHAGDPGTKPMLRPAVLDTTLRLAPA